MGCRHGRRGGRGAGNPETFKWEWMGSRSQKKRKPVVVYGGGVDDVVVVSAASPTSSLIG